MDPNEWMRAGECPNCGDDALMIHDWTDKDGDEWEQVKCVSCGFEHEFPSGEEFDWEEVIGMWD